MPSKRRHGIESRHGIKSFEDAVDNQSTIMLANQSSAISRWRVSSGQVRYYRPNCHTLSIYLSGGHNSYRTDQKSNKGGRGKLCIMPQSQESQWSINDDIEFAHFYFSDEYYKQFGALNFDQDVRSFELKEMVYVDNPKIASLLDKCFYTYSLDASASLMDKDTALCELMNQIVMHCSAKKITPERFKGGLSGRQIKHIREMVYENINAPITLQSLASVIQLSPYHFARMFKLSMGITPAQYVLNCRLQVAKRLLSSDMPLCELSLECGFSHQSHMTATFNKRFGMTPRQFRLSSAKSR